MPRLPAIATVLSLLACYGTLIALAALGVAGITLTLNPGLWAASIVGFAVLALVGLYVAHRRHGSLVPSLIAMLGTAVLVVTSFFVYLPIVEAGAFLLLCLAVWLDWKKTRSF